MTLSTTDTSTFSELHDKYAERINMAVAEGRYDLILELAREYDLVRTDNEPKAA
jgi:hypothetical protein